MNSWGVIGHDWAVEYLRLSVAAGRDAHAYLLLGPEGIGKSLLALRLAQALNCEHDTDVPCRVCRTCQRIERGIYPDVRIASLATQATGLKPDEAARQKELKIDTVREWQRDITLRPYEGRRRVFILQNAEALSDGAANAMLKTLEEPPPYATLILTASRDSLLGTITSRCQVLRLRRTPRALLEKSLLQHTRISPEQARLIAAWSNGQIGWALTTAQQPDTLLHRQERLDMLLALQKQPRVLSFRWAEERSQEYRNGQQAQVFEWLELWRSWWHDVFLVAVGCPEYITYTDRRHELEQAARRYSVAAITAFLRRIGETAQLLRENVNPQHALENVLVHMPTG